jgi:hypothetical protein
MGGRTRRNFSRGRSRLDRAATPVLKSGRDFGRSRAKTRGRAVANGAAIEHAGGQPIRFIFDPCHFIKWLSSELAAKPSPPSPQPESKAKPNIKQSVHQAAFPLSSDVNEIVVCDDAGNELAFWHDDDTRLRLAAQDLLDALEELVARDRAEAAESGFTDDEMTWLEDARRAITRAKGGAA